MEQLKKDVFGSFVQVDSVAVDSTGPDALTCELNEFVTCIQTGTTPHVDGLQGLSAMRVADEVLKSVASHQWQGSADGVVGSDPESSRTRPEAA